MIRLGILGSTRGTNMLALVDAINEGILKATIKVVISNKPDAIILERAKLLGLNTQFVNPDGLSRVDFDKKVSDILTNHQVDLIVLIGYMRILSSDFVNKWNNRVINVHPSLLPAFAGKMDMDVHQAVLDSGLMETGCTIHYVTEEVDAGPIILQKKCPILEGDTPQTLKARVQQLEGIALIDAINLIVSKGL
ncbi:phosphoribosylglycinamide formyltransferase [Legionella pneumophila]|uniref:Phosphoribosylglycinamide formyltransferase n=1 Tax=Legionella pneumophila subsp. pascullei TaxID=91890 RepID=A0AAX2IXD2_LEGPN|nr:phosphoribosylglycinamide formyltransferase [Legionella pneumophila]AMP89676.1 phosphoribosylglycinamide formyltransferase [Legionella pneumophila subsp. pascullei]AMP92658.1 phosphoribosylglycinamide formyltransferase [Legionella pneumophila subsp. pascullei]AMP95623.1 phosphoribosylglycinamide formyltransferase [Legionella pneumophila subsp. pascullei]SQG90533.1 phosphoribosylglycinamide formyltransferase 1 [Legionella pneumophila subsp. pascullei]VEH07078.1 phosphoribosylglycinamide form